MWLQSYVKGIVSKLTSFTVLVVSTHLKKYESKWEIFPYHRAEFLKNIWNHHLAFTVLCLYFDPCDVAVVDTEVVDVIVTVVSVLDVEVPVVVVKFDVVLAVIEVELVEVDIVEVTVDVVELVDVVLIVLV